MKRLKKISPELFKEIADRNWLPVELMGDALPDFVQAIPANVRYRILASGEANSWARYASESIPSGRLVGGIDVYRNAPDDPVAYNKDWYALVRSPADSCAILVDGPHRDSDHWLDELPKRFEGVEILGVPKKPQD